MAWRAEIAQITEFVLL